MDIKKLVRDPRVRGVSADVFERIAREVVEFLAPAEAPARSDSSSEAAPLMERRRQMSQRRGVESA